MKTSQSHSNPLERRRLKAAVLTLLLGGATALAQTSSSSSSTTTPRADGSYGSSPGATGAPTTTGEVTQSTSSASPGHTPRAEGSYGSGAKAGSAHTGSASSASTDRSTSTDTTSTSTTPAADTTARGSTTASTTDTAGGATTMTGRDSAKLGWMERRWVNKVADSGTTEIALARLATERASNPEVKSFAQKLVDDHTKVADELKSLAGQKNVKLDEEDLGSDRAHKRLSQKSGTEFDQEFIEHMVDMHETDVKLFEKASTDAKDSAIKSFAARHVDHLRQHLQQAQSLRSTIMPTGRTDTSTEPATSASPNRSGTDATSSSSSSQTGASSTSAGTTDSSTTDTTRRDPR